MRAGVAAPRVAILALGLIASAVLALGVGASGISPGELGAALLGAGDPAVRAILMELRLPRLVMAVAVGGALALAGVTFQALLRNPLAEPYVLGISGGAAVGAVTVLVAGVGEGAAWAVPAAAFGGALTAMFLVHGLAAAAGGSHLDPPILILAGVVVAAFFNALVLLLLTLAEAEAFRSAVFWTMGNLSGATWTANAVLALHLVPASLVLFSLARAFDLLSRGEDVALHLGVSVTRTKLLAYVVASLLVAAAVAGAGVIGFVGLVVPHAVRLLWGSGHRLLIPASFLAGGVFLLLSDTVARVVVAPAELPTGVVTALAGVPVFVAILVRRGVR